MAQSVSYRARGDISQDGQTVLRVGAPTRVCDMMRYALGDDNHRGESSARRRGHSILSLNCIKVYLLMMTFKVVFCELFLTYNRFFIRVWITYLHIYSEF